MTDVPDRLVTISAALYEAGTLEAAIHDRTPRQQLEHWARVGRAVTGGAGPKDAGADKEPLDVLRQPKFSASRAEMNTELNAKIAAAVDAANFGATLAARGLTTVALDDEGRLVEYRPDGSTSIL